MSEVPTGVGVITCMGSEGIIGCTISSVVSVSVESNEEKVLFALKKDSYIGKIIGQKSKFSLSILSEHQADIASSAGGKLKHSELTSFLEGKIGTDSEGEMYIEGSKLAFSLLVEEIFDANNSSIFLCKVQAATVYGDIERKPLIYFRRSFVKMHGISN